MTAPLLAELALSLAPPSMLSCVCVVGVGMAVQPGQNHVTATWKCTARRKRTRYESVQSGAQKHAEKSLSLLPPMTPGQPNGGKACQVHHMPFVRRAPQPTLLLRRARQPVQQGCGCTCTYLKIPTKIFGAHHGAQVADQPGAGTCAACSNAAASSSQEQR